MATIIFSVIIGIAIFLFIADRNLLIYYFIFLYPILPEYLAVSFTSALPLLTASRALLIIMFFSVLIKGRINISVFRIKYFGKAFLFYLVCQCAICISHIRNIDSIKTFIGILLENLLFIFVMMSVVNTEEKLKKCIEVLIASAAFVFVMGLLEPITSLNLSSTFLDTGSRDSMLISTYERYNSTRAVFTFGHAIALGIYCIALFPLIMNKINETRKFKFYVIFELGIGCLLMTMSRGVIIVFIFVLIYSIMKLDKRSRRGYFKALGLAFIGGVILIICVPSMYQTLRDTILDSLNALGANFSVSSSGGNDNAVLSRTAQLSYIPQILKTHPLFGGGTGYLTKTILYVYTSDRTFVGHSVDIEYLRMFIEQGIVGVISGVVLYSSVLVMVGKHSKYEKDELSKYFFLSFLSIFLGYFTVAQLTTGNILWMLIALYLCYLKTEDKSKQRLRSAI